MKLHFSVGGAGPPVIILHGLFGSLNNWQSISRRLGSSFRVFTVDQRNHGHSPHSSEFSYAAMAADLLEFLDEHGLPSASIVGHSMGGKTAMEFAVRHPGRTAKLVVVDIAPRAYPRGHDAILDAMIAIELSRYHSRDEFDVALAPAIPDPRVRQFILTNLKRHAGGAYTWKVNLDVVRDRYDEVIRGLEAPGSFPGPALFLAGAHSDYVSESDLPQIWAHFPSALLRIIPGAGHWLHADAPEEFLNAVTPFLSR